MASGKRVVPLGSVSVVSTRSVVRGPLVCAKTSDALTIIQLVDTKSVNNTTLLHFLERTVSKHFPEMEVFIAELEKPAEAYRGMSSPSTILPNFQQTENFRSTSSGCPQKSRGAERRAEEHED